jgi:hypothetical protein
MLILRDFRRKYFLILLMQKLGSKVVRGKVERIGLDLLLRKMKILIDIGLDRVQPISIVPYMEVLLVLH